MFCIVELEDKPIVFIYEDSTKNEIEAFLEALLGKVRGYPRYKVESYSRAFLEALMRDILVHYKGNFDIQDLMENELKSFKAKEDNKSVIYSVINTSVYSNRNKEKIRFLSEVIDHFTVEEVKIKK